MASYNSEANDLSFITSAADILPYLVNAQNDIVTSTINQRISKMALLKLVTMSMTLSDRCDLAYFGHPIVKNGKRTSLPIKMNSSMLEETLNSVERH